MYCEGGGGCYEAVLGGGGVLRGCTGGGCYEAVLGGGGVKRLYWGVLRGCTGGVL